MPTPVPCKKKEYFCKEICAGLGYLVDCKIKCWVHFWKVEGTMKEYCEHGVCSAPALAEQVDIVDMVSAEEASLLQRAVPHVLAVQESLASRTASATVVVQSSSLNCKTPDEYCKHLCYALGKGGLPTCAHRCTEAWGAKIKPIFDTFCEAGVCPCPVDETNPFLTETEESTSLLQSPIVAEL